MQNSRAYDGAVLDPFGKILADGVEKRFIIVHLLGTHMRYEFRYPPEDEYFKGRDGLPEWADEEQTQFINEYDNAVRYNDFVVGSLIEQLRSAQLKACCSISPITARMYTIRHRTNSLAATKPSRHRQCTPCPSFSGNPNHGAQPIHGSLPESPADRTRRHT